MVATLTLAHNAASPTTMALLYYNPMTFSSSSFITAHVTGALADKRVVATLVDLEPGNPKSKHQVVSTGADYRKFAPRGAVPVLDIPGKAFLDENVSVLLHLADSGSIPRSCPPTQLHLQLWPSSTTTP